MFPYKYTIIEISEGQEVGFKAIIPAFPNLYVLSDSPAELHETVKILVNEEIECLKSKNKKIPKADNAQKFSGTFTIRIKPELHKRISELAQSQNISTNKYMSDILERGIHRY